MDNSSTTTVDDPARGSGVKGPYTRTQINAATHEEQKGAGPFVEEPNRNFSLLSIMYVPARPGALQRHGRDEDAKLMVVSSGLAYAILNSCVCYQ